MEELPQPLFREDGLRVAIVGATGLVGRTMLEVLAERKFPLSSLRLLASERSAGEQIDFISPETAETATLTVEMLTEESFDNIDVALFSAGGAVSKKFAPIAAARGCVAIDNSSAWRMNQYVPLVVPEVNPEALDGHHGIIANPNCSTIQLVVALEPLHEKFTLRRVVVSTYQSPSGAGQRGLDQLEAELDGDDVEHPIFPIPIAFNTVFHTMSGFGASSEEEIKIMNETRKIMNVDDLKIAVTCVRVPIYGGHGESVAIETERPFTLEELRDVLAAAPGIVIMDTPEKDIYPTPIVSADTDNVYVGRIRKDTSVENGGLFWVVADNLRKGAATNAVQIAENLFATKRLAFSAHEALAPTM